MIDNTILEKAAQTLAEQFDYPWEHMPEKGRDNMRRIACLVIDEAVNEERERCAQIAASYFGCDHIADEIREGANRET